MPTITTKHLYISAGVIIVLIVLIFLPIHKVVKKSVPLSGVATTTTPTGALPASVYATTTLIMAGHAFTTEISDTPALQELGLSYRTSIAPDFAMLFVFDTPSTYQFWMKDMNFPLDIIWLNASKHIVYIQKNLSPNTYPQSYGPSTPAQYVIEVASGTAERIGLKVGDPVTF
jgi:uncharacterized membrane protein (UPF0127 family)